MKMAKATKIKQFEIMINFMEKNLDVARGNTNSANGRIKAENVWRNINKACNAEGPPVKTVDGWKKVWSDYKFFFKKKLRQNVQEQQATGGGIAKMYSFSPLQEKVIDIYNLRGAVFGIINTKSFGTNNVIDQMKKPYLCFKIIQKIMRF